jgi:dolichyl-phosphate beta-glucosyltransferase
MWEAPLAFIVGGFSALYLALIYLSPTPRKPVEEEWKYRNNNGRISVFPHLQNAPSKEQDLVYLSVIVPAYNEFERLPIMMKETLEYLDERLERDPTFSCEIIIVDDASKDKTSELGYQIQKEAKEYKNRKSIRVMTQKWNRGKGGTVIQVFPIN